MAKNLLPTISFAGLTDLLGYQIRQAQTASFRDLAGPFRKLGITPGEFSLLTIIDANMDIRQLDLVRFYGLDKSTLSVAVNRLSDRGMIRRRRLPQDRRNQGLSLTDAGQDLLQTATRLVNDQEDRMKMVISPQELDVLMGALRRIAATLRDR